VDHLQSKFFQNTSGCKEAYQRLWHEIGQLDGQVIWCSTTKEGIPRTGILKMLWCLDVAESTIICRIDDVAWNKILGVPSIALPRHLKDKWNRHPLDGDWWNELISYETQVGHLWSALIRHPVSPTEVLKKMEWHSGDHRGITNRCN